MADERPPDAHDPGTPPEPSQPAPPPEPGPAAGPPPKPGMSTGTKVAIGCGIVALLAIVAIVAAGFVGGMFLKQKAGGLMSGIEAQQNAGERIGELEEEHGFEPPADGIVDPGRARVFLDVTDDAWDRMRSSLEDLADRGRRIEGQGEAELSDVAAGLRGFGEARLAVAEALESAGMPLSEYLWTAGSLLKAYRSLGEGAGGGGVPPENLELARRYRARLAELERDDEDRPSKGAVLHMAASWGMTSPDVRSFGWDSIVGEVLR